MLFLCHALGSGAAINGVSSTVSLREVVGPPQIVRPPASQSRFEGQDAVFSVTASGQEPLRYFWRKGSTLLPGANASSLTLSNVQLSDAGGYSVVVSNAGGTVTSGAAQLTVKLPPPPWFESWESAATARHVPSNTATTFIKGDAGSWMLVDTASAFPECSPNSNRADIVVEDGRKLLRLQAAPNDGGCAENVWVSISRPAPGGVSIPLLPSTEVSFRQAGVMTNPDWNGMFSCLTPPCGDTTHLRVVDDHNNHVVYVLQRAPNYVEHALTNGPSTFGYREILLDPGGGVFSRNLYADLASVAGSARVGAQVIAVEFALSAAGWAELDDLRIGVTSGTSDQTAPSLTMTRPADKTRVFSPMVMLTGTARDNVAVERVEVRVGSEPYQAAAGTANWKRRLLLAPGPNLVWARAKDTSGNYSAEVVRTLIHAVTSSLTLSVGVGGRVTGGTNGQALEVGRAYTLTAVPDSGYVFAGWSEGTRSLSNKLTFLMTSNLVLRADFLPNPFLATKGMYTGLFYAASGVMHESSGFFTATVTDRGNFTASLQSNGKRLPVSGNFDIEGKASRAVLRPDTSSLMLELRLDVSQGTDRLTGTVSDGAWTADLVADRAVFNARTNPAAMFTNTYTLLVPGGIKSSVAPAGDGGGSVVVKADGIVALTGLLADGSAAAQRVALSKGGDWPLYLSLYGGKGSLLGWLHLVRAADFPIGGRVNWARSAQVAAKEYPNGFMIESFVLGSAFARVVGTNRLLNLSTGRVVFAQGPLPAAFTNFVSWSSNGLVTNRGPSTLTLNIKRTGLFDGTVTPPGATEPQKFNGVLLQDYGGGFFIRSNQSGHVYFGR